MARKLGMISTVGVCLFAGCAAHRNGIATTQPVDATTQPAVATTQSVDSVTRPVLALAPPGETVSTQPATTQPATSPAVASGSPPSGTLDIKSETQATASTPRMVPATQSAASKPSAIVVTISPPMAPAASTTQSTWDAPVVGRPVAFWLRAEGVQIYEPTLVEGRLQWALKGPDTLIYDAQDREVGRHFANASGGVWEYRDGSRIIGKKTGFLPKPGTVPWLTITIVGHEGTEGKLSGVSHIQRVDTVGGLPPSTPPMPEQIGKEERVPYRATYLFYLAK